METILTLLVTPLITYMIWRVQRFARTYMIWCRLFKSDKVQSIGKLHPIWGNLHLFSDINEIFDQIEENVLKTKTKLIGFWIGFLNPLFIATHPDTVKVLMKSTEPKPTYPGSGYNALMPWLGDGLLISKGHKWERNRRLITPAFHFKILRPYVKVYNEVADILLDKFASSSEDAKKTVEIYEPVGLAAFDTMLRCAFSYNGDVQKQGNDHPYVNAVKILGKLAMDRIRKPWQFHYQMFRLTRSGKLFLQKAKYIHEFDEKLINIRRNAIKEDNSVLDKPHLDFLDMLLVAKDENGLGLTNREIRDEVDTFLFEGHDTTASAITWAIYALGKHQEEQERVFKEVSSIIGDRTEIKWEDLSQLHRLSLFVKESMRHYSPVPGISRVTTKDTEINGVIIPANVEVWLSILAVHTRADVWENPQKFDPERFLETDVKSRDPYSYIPFSAGPRNCIGQHFVLDEIKVIIARLVKRFRVTCDPSNEAKLYREVVTRSKGNGVHVYFHPRT